MWRASCLLFLLVTSCSHFERAERCKQLSQELRQGTIDATSLAQAQPNSPEAWEKAAVGYLAAATALAQSSRADELGTATSTTEKLLRRAAASAQGLADALRRGDGRGAESLRSELGRLGPEYQRQLERLRRLCRP